MDCCSWIDQSIHNLMNPNYMQFDQITAFQFCINKQCMRKLYLFFEIVHWWDSKMMPKRDQITWNNNPLRLRTACNWFQNVKGNLNEKMKKIARLKLKIIKHKCFIGLKKNNLRNSSEFWNLFSSFLSAAF